MIITVYKSSALQVCQKLWKVDVGARLFASLHLHSVNLPGGELRRKSIEDELMMSQYLIDGDLVSCEVSLPFLYNIIYIIFLIILLIDEYTVYIFML